MPKKEIRFCIHDGNGKRAATWKCWSPPNKKDIYIANRELGKALKISLHESGEYHSAFYQEFWESNVPETQRLKKNRYIKKWNVPPEFAPGCTLVLRVVTPYSSTTVPYISGNYKNMQWIDNCPKSKATEIDFIITTKDTTVSDWPGKCGMGNKLIGSYDLPDGSTLWVVYMTVDMPNLGTIEGKAIFFGGMNKKDLVDDNIRIMMQGSEPDGSRVLYDCTVGVRKKYCAFVNYIKYLNVLEKSGIKVTLPRGKFFDKFI